MNILVFRKLRSPLFFYAWRSALWASLRPRSPRGGLLGTRSLRPSSLSPLCARSLLTPCYASSLRGLLAVLFTRKTKILLHCYYVLFASSLGAEREKARKRLLKTAFFPRSECPCQWTKQAFLLKSSRVCRQDLPLGELATEGRKLPRNPPKPPPSKNVGVPPSATILRRGQRGNDSQTNLPA